MPQNNMNMDNQGSGPPDQKRVSQHDVPAQQPASKKSNRGFASMDAAKQREIASKGGRAAHQKGTAHQFTPDEAREAGRKGGGTVSQDRQHMAEIGRIGGQSRGQNRAKRGASPSSEAEQAEGAESAVVKTAQPASDEEPDSSSDVAESAVAQRSGYRH